MELFSKKEVIGLSDNFPIQQNAWLFKKIILKIGFAKQPIFLLNWVFIWKANNSF